MLLLHPTNSMLLLHLIDTILRSNYINVKKISIPKLKTSGESCCVLNSCVKPSAINLCFQRKCCYTNKVIQPFPPSLLGFFTNQALVFSPCSGCGRKYGVSFWSRDSRQVDGQSQILFPASRTGFDGGARENWGELLRAQSTSQSLGVLLCVYISWDWWMDQVID